MHITATDILEDVIELAKEDPYRVADCKYFDEYDGSPCCIVGHALARRGISANTLRSLGDFETLNMYTCAGPSFESDGILQILGIEVDDEYAREMLETIQIQQDTGLPWGKAVEYAKKTVLTNSNG